MNKYIDVKTVAGLVAAGVILFFLQKWFTKRMQKADGTVSHYVGNDALGYV